MSVAQSKTLTRSPETFSAVRTPVGDDERPHRRALLAGQRKIFAVSPSLLARSRTAARIASGKCSLPAERYARCRPCLPFMTEAIVDPVCGMVVDPSTAVSARLDGHVTYFCSNICRYEFFRRPANQRAVIHEAQGSRRIAFFSMEVAMDERMPTYSGGLGVLAGDMLRSCADLSVPIVGVTLLYREGSFTQRLNDDGVQSETPERWRPEALLVELPVRVSVEVEGRTVAIRVWRHEIIGSSGYVVPVLLLDSDVAENSPEHRALTNVLYGGDAKYRLSQEVVLGFGGVRALRAAGYDGVRAFHLNEGHASFAAVELFREASGDSSDRLKAVRERCIFTTHTPVPAGHDRFDYDLVRRVVGDVIDPATLRSLGGVEQLNMTLLASNTSHFVNGVARRHQQVAEQLFPGRDIRHVTNGVHSVTWTCDAFRRLFDEHIPEWRDDPAMLRKALSVPPATIWTAHEEAKASLFSVVRDRTGIALDPARLTIGFARRSAAYKRADLVFADRQRLLRLGKGRLQFVFAGKAHPADEAGKALIQHVVRVGKEFGTDIPVVYLADYDAALAQTIVAGVDLWINTPLRPLEASGTSGMKAAHNGVPSLSILDGWWLEGCVEGVTGWSIGTEEVAPVDRALTEDATSLYEKLEREVLPIFFTDRDRWIATMKHAIALNASYFNTHRVVQQYVTNAYLA